MIVAGTFRSAMQDLLMMWTADPEVLRETPRRVLRAYEEMLGGYDIDPDDLLSVRFPASTDELVVLKDIEFTSVCEHHLMPFSGRAHLGYLPDQSVVGLSKLARLVDCYAMRLQLQERLCFEIATTLQDQISGRGAACVIEASHGCMSCRGVRKSRATFVTSAMMGRFRHDPALRAEFFSAISVTQSAV